MNPLDQVTLRAANPADAAALALVGQATFLETFAGLHTAANILAHCERQHAPRVYADWLADARCAAWLLEAVPGNAPVGYAVMAPADVPVPDPHPDDLEIKRIYLLHRYQRGGWGRRLMDAAIAHARARGSSRLLLGVWSTNEAALAFYERIGFTRAGTRTFRIGAQDCVDHLLALAL
jgi:diamine N-acetyltransferase